jgi:hypothetical protein
MFLYVLFIIKYLCYNCISRILNNRLLIIVNSMDWRKYKMFFPLFDAQYNILQFLLMYFLHISSFLIPKTILKCMSKKLDWEKPNQLSLNGINLISQFHSVQIKYQFSTVYELFLFFSLYSSILKWIHIQLQCSWKSIMSVFVAFLYRTLASCCELIGLWYFQFVKFHTRFE